MISRRLLLLLVTLVLSAGAPGTAAAASGGDNTAVAINRKDGSSLFKFAFSMKKVLGEVVDNTNAAVAYASCESCRTTAIAIQIVLVSGSPTTVVPQNYAVSLNESCTLCQTFSTAFQFVIGVEDPSVGLTKAGKRELREILREFKALKKDEYTLAEFHARTQALRDRLRTVLKTQLVSKRQAPDVEDGDDLDAEEDEEAEEEVERPAPPPAPSGETTSGGDTTTAPATTETAPATTETAPATTETAPAETTPPATTAP
jgi:putative peptide zinc metalloprotease protein